MKQIIECVMNVSEGKDSAKLQAIAAEIEGAAESYLLSCAPDGDHHRAVYSFIGTPVSILAATFAAIHKAVDLIDLGNHRGVHPRIGAVDVVPFVPLKGVSMQKCVELARRLGKKVAHKLQIPVYLYERAALRPERRSLSQIRKGGFELLLHQVVDPSRRPDFGPLRLHPSAGATVIGARDPLIAFNIYLNASEAGVAKKIAARIRETSRGLPGVRALGFLLPSRNQAQVSTNVTNYRQTPLLAVYEKVCEEASRLGYQVVSSEVIGLVPREALPNSVLRHLRLENFHPGLVLESRISEVLGVENHKS